MPGINIFKTRQNYIELIEKIASSRLRKGDADYLTKLEMKDTPCVFICHRSTDKPAARAVDELLRSWGFNTYFDENDTGLQAAFIAGDAEETVRRIDDGLIWSSHLLGVVSASTMKSWWVPYEIGSARARDKKIAHLMLEVAPLPDYIKIGRILTSQFDLWSWAVDEIGPGRALEEGLEKTAAEKKRIDRLIPPHRTESERRIIMG